MHQLFESTKIKGMNLLNRFVRSATWEAMAGDDGCTTEQLVEFMCRLAAGGVGLIITGHTYVSREGQAGPRQLGIYADKLLPGLTSMAKRVHDAGGTIALQLAHAGLIAPQELSGLQPIGPSKTPQSPGRQMTREEIEAVAQSFVDAAARARAAGFDAVQLHAAHGYLLSQFLSPYFNKRGDDFGGGIENRARLAVTIVKDMRKVLGPDYPVLLKINSEDFLEGGLTVEDMLMTVGLLEKAGVDAIELSGGTFFSGKFMMARQHDPRPGEPEAYYETAAKRAKEKLIIPLMLVGGIRSYDEAERLVSEGVTDYVSFCRPLIREPELVNRWKSGDRKRATCISDNSCHRPTAEGKGLYCVVEARRKASHENRTG